MEIAHKNISFMKYAGINESFWYLPPKPYSPPIDLTGATGTINIYDKCGGTLLLTATTGDGGIVFSTETASFTEVDDNGVETDYSIPNTALITVKLTPVQVANFVNPYYDLFITIGTTITPLANGYLNSEVCGCAC